MGWNPIKKVTDTVKGIVKSPTNFKNYADLGLESLSMGQIDTNGVNVPGGSFEDILLGKKSKNINPDAIANLIRATQTKGVKELNTALDTPSENIVREQNARETKSILASAKDARRNAQATMARAGIAGTSLGLAANRSIDQSAGRDIASVNAQLPGQIRNQKLQDAQTRINVGGVNQNGMNFNTIEGSRSGGVLGYAAALAPLMGQAAGAYKDYQTGGLAAKRAGAY